MEATARLTQAQRARNNQRHIRVLLAIREPELSAAITHLTCLPCGPGCCLLPHWIRAEPSGTRA